MAFCLTSMAAVVGYIIAGNWSFRAIYEIASRVQFNGYGGEYEASAFAPVLYRRSDEAAPIIMLNLE